MILSSNTNNNKHRKTIINRVLVIFIVICFIVLVYTLSYQEPVDKFKPKFPSEGIINIHEHIHRSSDAEKWLLAMDECGVSATVMVGSPEVTFKLNSPPGFNNYSINNEIILYLEKKHDSKILAFPTIDPRDPNKLEMLKDQINKGAVGLKLFSGHTGEIYTGDKETIYDYLGPLNRSDMYGVYEYCERNKVPIIWHIKIKWDYLLDEINAVLEDFPNLIVNIPHFGVVGTELYRLAQLMDDYPGIYTDVSLGGFAKWSMELVSNNIDDYREFVLKYHERVMFGTDIVVTNNIRKTVPWIVNLTMGYRNMLEKDVFDINVSNITGEGFDFNGTLNGFGLSKQILDEIYFDNALKFLKGEPVKEQGVKSRGSSNSNSSFEYGYNPSEIFWVKIEIFHWDRIIIATNENSRILIPNLN